MPSVKEKQANLGREEEPKVGQGKGRVKGKTVGSSGCLCFRLTGALAKVVKGHVPPMAAVEPWEGVLDMVLGKFASLEWGSRLEGICLGWGPSPWDGYKKQHRLESQISEILHLNSIRTLQLNSI